MFQPSEDLTAAHVAWLHSVLFHEDRQGQVMQAGLVARVPQAVRNHDEGLVGPERRVTPATMELIPGGSGCFDVLHCAASLPVPGYCQSAS